MGVVGEGGKDKGGEGTWANVAVQRDEGEASLAVRGSDTGV